MVWPPKRSTSKPNPYGWTRPLFSVTGVKICFQLSGAQDRAAANAAIPRDQILQRQVQRAVCSGVQRGRHPLLIAQFAALEAVTRRAMRNHIRLADDSRRGHSEWLEYLVPQHVAVEHTGGFPDDDAEQHVGGVAVLPFRAGREVERQCLRERDEIVLRIVLAIVDQAVGVIRNAGRMGQQVAHGDVTPRRGPVAEELRERIGQCQPARFHLQHHRGGGELLAERARLKDRLRRHRNVVFDVGEPVAFGREHAAALDHRHRHPRDALRRHLLEDDGVDRIRLRGGHRRVRQRDTGQKNEKNTRPAGDGEVLISHRTANDTLPARLRTA